MASLMSLLFGWMAAAPERNAIIRVADTATTPCCGSITAL
jgi:hypothetical protein